MKQGDVDEPEIAALFILDRYHISKLKIVEAAAPCLDLSDRFLRGKFKNQLDQIDHLRRNEKNELNRGDYRVYQEYMESRLQNGKEIPLSLVKFIYSKNPGLALLCMMSALKVAEDERKSIRWAEHVIDDAIWKNQYGFELTEEGEQEVKTQLLSIARWVRLFAAEVIRQHSEVAFPELIELLEKDGNETIQNVLKGRETVQP